MQRIFEKKLIIINPTQMENKPKLRVAGYARVSSDSDDQLNSFSAQVSYYNDIITNNDDWQLVDIYADEGISGTTTEKRNDFNRMIDDCRKGRIDRILTKSTSRFARNTLDTLELLRELKLLGVTVYFEKEGIDTEFTSGEMLLTVYATLSQQESESISKNCKIANRKNMEKGIYVSSSPPYGYRLIDKKLEIYEPEAEIVRRIFIEYLDGKGSYKISRDLKAENIQKKDGDTNWRQQTVRIILQNERYKGCMLMQKSYNEDILPYKKRINKGELPKYYVENTHEAIITPIQFELANIMLKERCKKINLNCSKYPLSKKISCKKCGTTYRRKPLNNVVYYVCKQHDTDKNDCNSVRITESAIYESFVRMFNKLKANSEVIVTPYLEALEKIYDIKNCKNAEISQLNLQIASLAKNIRAMSEMIKNKTLSSAIFVSEMDSYNRELVKLKQKKSKILSECESNEKIEKVEILLDILDENDYLTEFNEEIFSEMVTRIYAHNNKSVEIELIGGLKFTERL